MLMGNGPQCVMGEGVMATARFIEFVAARIGVRRRRLLAPEQIK
jgi:hypothetical protein